MFTVSKEQQLQVQEYRQIFRKNSNKVADQMISELNLGPKSLVLLQSAKAISVNDEDTEYTNINQCSHFMYLFGLEDQLDCYGILDIHSKQQIIFIQRIPEDYKLWMKVQTKQEFQKEQQFDQVYYVDELEQFLNDYQPDCIYLNDGVNSDSKLRPRQIDLEFINRFKTNKTDLFDIMTESRVVKSEEEIKLMEWITQLSCEAHVEMMKNAKVGMKEYQLKAIFKSYISNHCNGKWGYGPICGSGTNCSILHYTNDQDTLKDGQLLLCDMGAKYKGYVSDITVSFPINGSFSQQQKLIYEAVLDANNQVRNSLKPGIKWDDMHILAEKVIGTHLQKIGILKQEYSVDEMVNQRVVAVFMPHGVGHLIGLAVHDVGGYNKHGPPRSELDGLNKLRTRRTMQPNMCITIEPGCYFIDFLLKRVQNQERAKYIDWDVIQSFRDIGGVRIEDNVRITQDGCVNMTADLPRTIQQIENCLGNLQWK